MHSLILANPSFDKTQYQLSIQTLRNRCKDWGLNTARKQAYTCMEDVKDVISAARERYPTAGKRGLIAHVFQEEGIKITEEIMVQWMHTYEPEATVARRANRLKRKRFWAAGVNDLWCIDQHDKLARFKLRLHACVEPYSGMIIWLRVWWSNSNPRLICHYYLDAVRTLGFIPLVTQSDPGSENFGVANAHTALRHLYDPSLQGTIQHRTMRGHSNIKSEILWKETRRHGSPGIENVLDLGLINHWYDPENPLHAELGSPRIDHTTIWIVFVDMLNKFLSEPTEIPDDWVTTEPEPYSEGVFDLDPQLIALPAGPDVLDSFGNFYLGGVREELEAAEAAANDQSFDGIAYGTVSDEEV
ncbi:hypothetical protein FRC07_005097 [Ceratobasidium sp. 392]|nr:hypothetical protein FRC07_005097 [Ceratobasidium sp. 392]